MEAIGDPNLLDFRQDIALLSARLMELLQTGESAPLWSSAQKAVVELKTAFTQKNTEGIFRWLRDLEDLVTRGNADSLRWQEIYELANNVASLKDKEHRRLIAMQQMITAEHFIGLLGQIAMIAKQSIRHEDDLERFSTLLNEYRALDSQRALAG